MLRKNTIVCFNYTILVYVAKFQLTYFRKLEKGGGSFLFLKKVKATLYGFFFKRIHTIFMAKNNFKR